MSEAKEAAEPEERVVIDPYFHWAERTNFVYLFAGRFAEKRIPVAIQLRRGFSSMRLANGEWNPPGKRDEWRNWLRIPRAYASPPQELHDSRFCTASVTQQFFTELRTPGSSLRRVVLRIELGLPFPERPLRPKTAPPVPASRKPTFWQSLGQGICKLFGHAQALPSPAPRVVVAVIDDGLAFAHQRFRRTDGSTRIEYLWNQDGPASPPPDFPYGRELLKAGSDGIDSWMAYCTNAGLVDEDDVYCNTGHLLFGESGHKPVAWRVAHGTHVMDLACGFDPIAGADELAIIGVQLPVASTADPSGATLVHRIIDALYYIVIRANSTPVVVNLSYGLTSGPHDGSSVVEQLVDEYIAARAATPAPLAVVLPAGNSRLLRGHARFSLRAQKVQHRLYWRILPDDQTPSYLEIWLPKVADPGPHPKVKVKVKPPVGPESPWVQEGDPPYEVLVGGQPMYQVSYINAGVDGFQRGMILVSLAPTSTHEPALPVAPSGVWRVRLRRTNSDVTDIRAWIRRDDTPYGYPRRGRQSYFYDAGYPPNERYPRFDNSGREIDDDLDPTYPNNSSIKRDGTLNAIATGARSIVIGGVRRTTWRAAQYSAAGPTSPAPGRGGQSPHGPDAMVVSEDSDAARGILAAGSRSGSVTIMSGTSMAAPQLTRWLATQMAAGGAAGGPYDRDAVFNFARTGVAPVTGPDAQTRTEANPPPWPAVPPAPPATRAGGGRTEFVPPHRDRRIYSDP